MTQYISTTETAKMIRKALKESFPKAKFSVRSNKYAGGSSINVSWTDGPNETLVKSITDLFEGSYFCGMTDYKGSQEHMVNGVRTRFGADFIFTNREHSDDAIQKSINATWIKYQDNYEREGIEKPTLEDYRKGRLYNVRTPSLHIHGLHSVQTDINENLCKRSKFAAPQESKTVSSIFYMGDDGYGYGREGKQHLKLVKE